MLAHWMWLLVHFALTIMRPVGMSSDGRLFSFHPSMCFEVENEFCLEIPNAHSLNSMMGTVAVTKMPYVSVGTQFVALIQ